jgi:hypothetical protein
MTFAILLEGAPLAVEVAKSAEAMIKQLSGKDQAELKEALAAARARSDALHAQVQAEAKAAQ